nr:MAG TPA: portal protein [Caudoviricetes sp.]
MGFSIKKLLKKRERPETERIASVEITDQQVQEAVTEVCLRELAFWTCVGKIANALTKCEFRTFCEGEEVFGDEYYLWNYEPNRNQNKAEFLSKAMEKLFRNNELLIVESYDGQLFVADSFTETKNTLYGNTYQDVQVDDYQFSRKFKSDEVLHWKLNNKDVNSIIKNLYSSYNKMIEYSMKSYLKSRGSRGTLEISGLAQADKNFSEKLQTLMNDYFKKFFDSNNAVLPLYEGYKYTDLGSKTYSEGTSRDIKNQYDDIFDFTARGFSMPPSLAKGDVQDTSKAVDEMLTFCLDPLAQMLQQEINRKRTGKEEWKKGTCLQVNTTKVKHMDMFDIATPADKLISSGLYTVNMLLRAIGEPQVGEEWADTHMMTKNYAGIEEILREMNSTKGGETGGETI